jgi:hypothetical protein
MTDVHVAWSSGTRNRTLLYEAIGTVTLNVHNWTPNIDMLIRVDGSAGTVIDDPNAAAELLHPYATMQLALSAGDLVYATPAAVNLAADPILNTVAGRLTVGVQGPLPECIGRKLYAR